MRPTDLVSDVARLAGVDRRTVKKALEGKPTHHLVRESIARALNELRVAASIPTAEPKAEPKP